MADDFSGVTATLDQANYVQGSTATLKIAGNAISHGTGTMGPLVSTVVNPVDGATSQITTSAATITTIVATPAKIQSVVDQGNPARTWTVSPDGMTATAIA